MATKKFSVWTEWCFAQDACRGDLRKGEVSEMSVRNNSGPLDAKWDYHGEGEMECNTWIRILSYITIYMRILYA